MRQLTRHTVENNKVLDFRPKMSQVCDQMTFIIFINKNWV